jgi:hypothetical protein
MNGCQIFTNIEQLAVKVINRCEKYHWPKQVTFYFKKYKGMKIEPKYPETEGFDRKAVKSFYLYIKF